MAAITRDVMLGVPSKSLSEEEEAFRAKIEKNVADAKLQSGLSGKPHFIDIPWDWVTEDEPSATETSPPRIVNPDAPRTIDANMGADFPPPMRWAPIIEIEVQGIRCELRGDRWVCPASGEWESRLNTLLGDGFAGIAPRSPDDHQDMRLQLIQRLLSHLGGEVVRYHAPQRPPPSKHAAIEIEFGGVQCEFRDGAWHSEKSPKLAQRLNDLQSFVDYVGPTRPSYDPDPIYSQVRRMAEHLGGRVTRDHRPRRSSDPGIVF